MTPSSSAECRKSRERRSRMRSECTNNSPRRPDCRIKSTVTTRRRRLMDIASIHQQCTTTNRAPPLPSTDTPSPFQPLHKPQCPKACTEPPHHRTTPPTTSLIKPPAQVSHLHKCQRKTSSPVSSPHSTNNIIYTEAGILSATLIQTL